MKKISYSQFSIWDKCPWRWKLNYIENLREFTDNIYTLFGTSMHEVVQEYITTMYSETAKKADMLSLKTMLLTRMKENYLSIMDERVQYKNDPTEITTQKDMAEFYEHGCLILDFLKKKRGQYFSKRGYELVGIETPLDYDMGNGICFKGYLDIILKDTIRDVIKIIDIKTSTMGWNKWAKKDRSKSNQLLLYKQFYSKQFNHPMDKIEVEFFILKRKLYENAKFPQKRIQLFVPASGTPSINRVISRLKEFTDECFVEGEYNTEHIYNKVPTTKNCRFCEYKDRPDLCDRKA